MFVYFFFLTFHKLLSIMRILCTIVRISELGNNGIDSELSTLTTWSEIESGNNLIDLVRNIEEFKVPGIAKKTIQYAVCQF